MALPLRPACGYCICGRCNLDEAREIIARRLWVLDAGSDSAWPYAGELRAPFYAFADEVIALAASVTGQ